MWCLRKGVDQEPRDTTFLFMSPCPQLPVPVASATHCTCTRSTALQRTARRYKYYYSNGTAPRQTGRQRGAGTCPHVGHQYEPHGKSDELVCQVRLAGQLPTITASSTRRSTTTTIHDASSTSPRAIPRSPTSAQPNQLFTLSRTRSLSLFGGHAAHDLHSSGLNRDTRWRLSLGAPAQIAELRATPCTSRPP